MTRPDPGSATDAPGSDTVQPDAGDASRPRVQSGAPQRERRPPCGFDPFTAFAEWAGPIDEADYADL